MTSPKNPPRFKCENGQKDSEERFGDTELTRVECFLFSDFMFADFGVGGAYYAAKRASKKKRILNEHCYYYTTFKNFP